MHFNKNFKNTISWKLLNTAFIFFINLLMVRLLSVSESGMFFYDITLLSFLILILSLSIESGITYYAVKDNTIIRSILTILIPLLTFQVFLSWVVIRNVQLSISMFFALLFILGNLCNNYFSAIFYAQKWFVLLSIISCCVNFLVILALICSYFYLGNGDNSHLYYKTIYISGMAFQATLLVLILGFKFRKSKAVPVNLKALITNIFTYSSVAFISNMVFFLVTRIDYFFVEKYCSSFALGNYVQVSKFGQLLILIPSITATMVFPYSADKTQRFTLQKVQQLCKSITMFFIPVSLLFVLSGYYVLPFIFGKGFNLMYVALLLYMPGFFALSIISILAAYLAGENYLIANLVASVLALIIVIIGDVLMIPLLGINAAAAVSSVAYIACGCYLLHIFKVKYNCRSASFFYFKKEEIFYIFKQFTK